MGFAGISVESAHVAILSAAPRYRSIRTGDTVSTSPMLSKPSPESSVGKYFSARKDTPRRSRIVLLYSLRLSRWAVIRPGSEGTALSVLSNALWTNAVNAAMRSAGGFGTWGGGISPARTRRSIRSHVGRALVSDSREVNAVTSNPPDASRALWHPAQVCVSSGRTDVSKSAVWPETRRGKV